MALVYILLIVFFSSVMDKTKDTIQYNSSIFKNWNPQFWNDEAWKGNFLPFTRYKFNAWHVSKSIMVFIICFIVSNTFSDFIAYGIFWNVGFDLLYDDILKSTKNA